MSQHERGMQERLTVEEKKICEIILRMEKPFRVSQLLEETEKEGLLDNELVLEVLGELCELGKVKYSEIDYDIWAYKQECLLA